MSEPTPQLPRPGPKPRYRFRVGYTARGSIWFPIALVVVGVLALLNQFGLLWWLRWNVFWPLALIAVGLALILRRWR